MNNPRITKKERNLIKGKINSVFSRSELRAKVIEAAILPNYKDEKRPKVKTWVVCAHCNKPEAKSYMEVDHKLPKIGLREMFDSISFDEYVDRVWCAEDNLQVLDPVCHHLKTAEENKLRRKYKKEANLHKTRKK